MQQADGDRAPRHRAPERRRLSGLNRHRASRVRCPWLEPPGDLAAQVPRHQRRRALDREVVQVVLALVSDLDHILEALVDQQPVLAPRRSINAFANSVVA